MEKIEVRRQLVHLSGIMLVILAQSAGGLLAACYAFILGALFLVYSEWVIRTKRRMENLLERMEAMVRKFVLKFERKEERPFMGAIWFFSAAGVTFLIFPLNIASAAVAILAVGDSLSTMIGIRFGRHKTIGSKSAEGTLAFLFPSFAAAMFFVAPEQAFWGSMTGAVSEMLLGHPFFVKKMKGKLNDNVVIPIVAGIVMYVLGAF